MNISSKSKNWKERILSNFAHTPFTIEINGEQFECGSVEGFWQGLKCTGEMRRQVFLMSGIDAKRAGKDKANDFFEIAAHQMYMAYSEIILGNRQNFEGFSKAQWYHFKLNESGLIYD